VRWELLFADLEAQIAALELADRAGEIEERARLELARVQLVDRLGAAVGARVRIRCRAGVAVAGILTRVGAHWLLIDEPAGRQALVALAAVLSVTGLGRSGAQPLGAVESRLGLAYALRGIARDRSGVRIDLIDGTSVDGTIDRVGADFVELAVHAAGELRRAAEVREVAIIALAAIGVVRRQAA
jgi:hypothetical protein